MRLAPTNIEVIGDELAVAWNDGQETFVRLKTLRRYCPCAGCAGEADVLGQVAKPEVTHTDASFKIRSHQLVGGYAWQPTWEDGHATGIFTFDLLRKLADIPNVP